MAPVAHGDQPPGVYCWTCQMWLASDAQFNDHCKGKKHRAAAAGNPRTRLSRIQAAREAAAQDAASQALLLIYMRCARRVALAAHAACIG
eukprot:8702837-Lingulodinium_polyedra.AAC.1